MTSLPQDFAASADRASPSATAGLIRFFVLSTVIAFFLSLTFRPYSDLSAFLLHRQDRWLLLVEAVLAGLCCVKLPQRHSLPQVRLQTWLVAALVMASVALAGHYWVLDGYDLSRDEQMASFDASVFAHGHLVAPLPPFWRDHADALNTMFMYPAQHRGGWISDYLPFNAALRGLVGLIGTPYLLGPLMTLLGALALWDCVKQLWPDDNDAACLALLLYLGSSQVLFAGMTSYAMPGHLALDLCWLALFLRRTVIADIGALAIGFVATGLHQPLMHPMFIAPFLIMMVIERRWDRAATYFIGYAAIGTFWLWWPTWIWSLVQSDAHALRPVGVDYMTRLTRVLREGDPMGMPNMVANVLRFIGWQHLLLVPLMIAGIRQYRTDPMIASLAAGIVITTVVMAIILPYQGHGFGYRYLHGLIGNAILLAVYGWKTLGGAVGQWRTLLLRTTFAGFVVIMPLQAWMAHASYATAAQTSARIEAIDADYVIIGRLDAPNASDLVINPAQLQRRPLLLVRDELTDDAIGAICAAHPTTALIGNKGMASLAAYYGFGTPRSDDLNAADAPRLTRAGCRVRRFD